MRFSYGFLIIMLIINLSVQVSGNPFQWQLTCQHICYWLCGGDNVCTCERYKSLNNLWFPHCRFGPGAIVLHEFLSSPNEIIE
ncbi:unnamed protein product [Macrosiphum euphorbiae]|uniref:Secreted protein n=1 Tax=Macrosiphum euphorbiae TaxID=13131 RepID=A0AAV0W5J8_9HEMI|nr:unnamed protein product [Macrosiphum euphorbiae]